MFQILIAGVDYSDAYKPGSLVIDEQTNSDRTDIKFTLVAPATVPVVESSVEIWESSDQRRPKEAAGRLKRVKQRVIGPDPVTLEPVFVVDCEVGGWARDLERPVLPTRTYTNKTTGFIFRDVCTFAPKGFDLSGITTSGNVQTYFDTKLQSIPKVLDRLMQQQGWQWWVDTDKTIYFAEVGTYPAPFSLTDDNWRDLTGSSLTVEPDTSHLANQIQLSYRGKYTGGTVSVSNGLNQVTGVGTQWLSKITPGSRFRLDPASSIAYTIQQVISDTSIYLSSAYNEATLTGQAYVIEDIPRVTQATDAASVNTMAKITGDNGIFSARVKGPGAFMTFEEAQSYLKGLLKQRANPLVNISFKSNSRLITDTLHAGQSVTMKLTEWDIDTTLQIKSVTKTDAGGVTPDGYPVYVYDLKFEIYLFDLAARYRLADQETTDATSTQVGNNDDIFGSYSDAVTFVENLAGVAKNLALAESVTATENKALVNSSPNGPGYYWGQVGRITTNTNGSLKDSVTNNPVIRWGYFQWG